MQVGDLVVQLGWEADGAGIVTRVWSHLDTGHGRAAVQWPDGTVNMFWSQLEILSEARNFS